MQDKTEKQKRAENATFLNKPCRFEQYINSDGTVGKKVPIDNHGAYIKINDAALVPSFMENHLKWEKANEEFHQKLMSLGVRSYRCNDGWVNREKCIVTFFKGEREKGWYWGMPCKEGDKIFIGNRCDGGRFAIITHIENIDRWSRSYYYKPLLEILDGDKHQYITKLTYKPSFLKRVFKPTPHLVTDICQSLE